MFERDNNCYLNTQENMFEIDHLKMKYKCHNKIQHSIMYLHEIMD